MANNSRLELQHRVDGVVTLSHDALDDARWTRDAFNALANSLQAEGDS